MDLAGIKNGWMYTYGIEHKWLKGIWSGGWMDRE